MGMVFRAAALCLLFGIYHGLFHRLPMERTLGWLSLIIAAAVVVLGAIASDDRIVVMKEDGSVLV